MIDRLALAMRRESVPPVKAETGIGAAMVANDPPLSMFVRSDQERMKRDQELAVANLWIRAAERAISSAFATVPWHMENAADEEITDESPAAYRAIRDLLEKPYTPRPGDPRSNTPRTRSRLWGITSRHMGVCGSSFWYLDQTEGLAGTPLQILYVNPARMTPAGEGGMIVGWILDKGAGRSGIPLSVDQVLHFTLEEPDTGIFPPGLVESVLTSIYVTKYGERHAMGLLASGGKMAGVYAPKGEAGMMPPDVFAQLEKDIRKANEDPDSTRRSVILRGPVEFQATVATPEQLDLVAMLAMERDAILNLWGVPISQLGGSVSVGLEGSKKGFDEAVFWQKAVSPRLRTFQETVQFEMLDRFAKIGLPVELEIEEPTFDDDAPRYEMAQAASSQPLTNRERREILGLDPFGDAALDEAIWMPVNVAELAMAPIEPVKSSLASYLAQQKAEVEALIREKADHLARRPNDERAWWNAKAWDERLAASLPDLDPGEIARINESSRKAFAAKVAEMTRPIVQDAPRSTETAQKGATMPSQEIRLVLPAPVVNVAAPVIPAPIVNVAAPTLPAPIVNVAAPEVQVAAPIVNVERAEKASAPLEVRILEMPIRRSKTAKSVKRVNGQITEIVEATVEE